jgi:hypothetical protein
LDAILWSPRAMPSRGSRPEGPKPLKNSLPCEAERIESLACLTGGPKEQCQAQFEAYRACMRLWRVEERKARIARRQK